MKCPILFCYENRHYYNTRESSGTTTGTVYAEQFRSLQQLVARRNQQKSTLKDKKLSGSYPHRVRNEFSGLRVLWFMKQLRQRRSSILISYLHISQTILGDSHLLTRSEPLKHCRQPSRYAPMSGAIRVAPRTAPCRPHSRPKQAVSWKSK